MTQSVMQGTHFAKRQSIDALKTSSLHWIDIRRKLVSKMIW
eukprot:CAMPEP_0194770358 /NCGR_PEP_ID=MMETSP0323_2-20130528/46026_1 /TAXON_ID=2866 ORGANISM="Crypthecodinium cohnii, Strain Seligo" /NCGR_SAMPLE_ID=MMETSP0323_2 /ASSEMBLY_ACC=CAM_ASM_000346 /LENGTH=40 /DNA_ID= /DNA_START= /DNA_END= /DNA_ORIENTATION=